MIIQYLSFVPRRRVSPCNRSGGLANSRSSRMTGGPSSKCLDFDHSALRDPGAFELWRSVHRRGDLRAQPRAAYRVRVEEILRRLEKRSSLQKRRPLLTQASTLGAG